MPRRQLLPGLLIALLFWGACQSTESPAPSARASRSGESAKEEPATVSSLAPAATSTPASARPLPEGVSLPPEWIGERVLPRDEDGFGVADRTPPKLEDRRFVSHDLLPPPGRPGFVASSGPVPRGVLRRSTWNKECPVAVDELSYLTVTFWGFDKQRHTGELIVNRSVARDVVSVFRQIHRARWPIEEMRVTARRELDAPPTGDGNNTSAFVCRAARLSEEWSEHAYGLAVDVNPFQNPYVRDDLTLPELAMAYRDRSWRRPGMLEAGDPVTSAFGQIGWEWGGDWNSSKDWMHFSLTGD